MTRSRTRIHPSAIALSAILALLAAAPAARAQADLTLIADQDTPVPGFPMETFSDFGEGAPVLAGPLVIFFGAYPSGSGIYVGAGGDLETVADETTVAPGSGGATFDGFVDTVSIESGSAAFSGFAGGAVGIYSSNALFLSDRVREGDPVPGTAATFTDVRLPSTSSGDVAFLGEASDGGLGIYLDDGSLVTIADDETVIPGAGADTFTSFENPLVSGGEVAFAGGDFGAGRLGLYIGSGGPLTTGVDEPTSPPGTSATFTNLAQYSFDEGMVAFAGGGPGFLGIYLGSGGALTTVVDQSTPLPGGGTFFSLGSLSISQGNVLFLADGELFFWESGSIQRVLGAGDLVDGRTVESLFLNAEGLDGRSFAVYVDFTDDSLALYRGEIAAAALGVPEVPTLGEWGLILLALGLAAAAAFVLRGTA
jgi:hypothetical protein